jgi:hypothetical protein
VQQTVNLVAAGNAAIASVVVTVKGTDGSVNANASVGLVVNVAQKLPHPPFRTGYVRTDAQWDTTFLNFDVPQRWIIYHAPTRRFFASNTFLNRIDVIDATTEQIVGQIPVPGAFVGDEAADHSAIYMGTQVGDVYKIDPVAMKVLQRFPAAQIGPQGFAAYEVRVLADGRLVMFGGQGGIPAVDGYSTFAIWNPADNSFFLAPKSGLLPGCSKGGFELNTTVDRTKVLLNGSCLYDPVTDAQMAAPPGVLSVGDVLIPADGKEFMIAHGNTVEVLDSTGLFPIDQFQVGTTSNVFFCSLSLDGNTLYVAPRIGGGNLLAYNWRTHQLLGWAPSMEFVDFVIGLHPDAIDESGLIAAVSSHGVSFLDAGAIHPGPPTSVLTSSAVSPSFGPPAGGTKVTFSFNANPAATSRVFFGNQLGANLALNGEGVTITSPAGAPGPVDVTGVLPDGNLVFAPESFSYGPSIVEVATDSTTAEGGGIGMIFGYGFGNFAFGGQAASGLQVSMNGQPVTNLKYTPLPFETASPDYLFPVELITFSLPAGTAGTNADLVVSDADGSATATQAIHYLPSVKTFPLPGSVLVQGIYDAKRDVYYFSDATKVQVFSKTQGKWLAPINMPVGATRLWGLSLSPDGSKLAVSDAGAARIYVLNPDTPTVVSTFTTTMVNDPADAEPGGLAVTDTGFVYYMIFSASITGAPGLHKLNITTSALSEFQSVGALALGADAFTRVLLSNDNARAYINDGGLLLQIDTATDTMVFNPVITSSDYELTLSSNQTWMSASEWLMDTSLNPESFLVLTDRQIITTQAVFGAKLSPDGALLFQPLVDGIAVFDGKLGTLRTRIALPVQLSANYDALVADGKDNVLVGITGQKGDGGVSVMDLSGLPVPPPLPFAADLKTLPKLPSQVSTAKKRGTGLLATPFNGFPSHVVNDLRGGTGLRTLPATRQ